KSCRNLLRTWFPTSQTCKPIEIAAAASPSMWPPLQSPAFRRSGKVIKLPTELFFACMSLAGKSYHAILRTMSGYDAIIVGAGPNGLSAAIELARNGLSVCVFEAQAAIGGGARTEEVTLPGFHHDICSAIHPMAALS